MSATDDFEPLDKHRGNADPNPHGIGRGSVPEGRGYRMKKPPDPPPGHETVADIFGQFMSTGHGKFWKYRLPDAIQHEMRLYFYGGFQSRFGAILEIFQKVLETPNGIPEADQLRLLNWQYELDQWRLELLAAGQADAKKKPK